MTPTVQRPSAIGLIGLVVMAVYLWWRDLAWMAHMADALPILAGFPLFFFLRGPAKPSVESRVASAEGREFLTSPAIGLLSLGIGLVLGANFPLALGWTLLFFAWLAPSLDADSRRRTARLLPLLLLSFPWLLQDGERIGWWFRLSGAWATEHLFSLLGFAVERQGTLVLIQGIGIGVDAPCAGLNVLQSLLLAGTALAFVSPGGKRWRTVPLMVVLVGMAWLANVLRLLLLCFAALTYGIEFARGAFHTWGGLFALMLMFGLCAALFSREGPRRRESEAR
ncbi:MAG: archaeosortase/exosortase family protein [Capsulimonadales bacterium]|nr:archaeosortase/exosortase family protein [Capsulimonadales bacterium]